MRYTSICLVEEITARRIMQIDGEIIVESEDESAEAVALSSSLHDSVLLVEQHTTMHEIHIHLLARRAIHHVEPTTFTIRTAEVMYHIFLHDASWHDPFRIDIHTLDGTRQERRLGGITTTSDAHRESILVIDRHQMKRWNVHQHISLVLVWRIGKTPTASLHIAPHPSSPSFVTFTCLVIIEKCEIERTFRLYVA